MLGSMTGAQAIVTGIAGIAGIVGIVYDYKTTVEIISKGGKEGNSFLLKLMSWLHLDLGEITALMVVVMLGSMALVGTVIGGYYAAIAPTAIAVTRAIQIRKNQALYKSIVNSPVKPQNGPAPLPGPPKK